MRQIQQNEATAAERELQLEMYDDLDGVTPKSGLALTVQVVKAGGSSYANIAGSSAEIGSGTYKVSLAAGDVDTLGEATLKISATGAITRFRHIEVVRHRDEIHLAKAALVNRREHTIDTGVDVIKDDDGSTTLKTMTPTEAGGVVTVTPS
jgi:hypothetical protein